MKRKKVSKAFGQKSRNEEAKAGQVEVQHPGGSIINLPIHILAAILFRLPIKEIIVCKCVCKSLYATISNPDFAQSKVFPIARMVDHKNVSRILYPLEVEQDEECMNMISSDQCHDNSEIFPISMKFNSKLKIPVRNFPLVLRDGIDGNKEITLKAKHHSYKIVNSCNGFLCLSEPLHNKPVAVCNPFTGEFINLPQVIRVDGYHDYIDCGFGYSPKTHKYKVVRIFEQDPPLKHVTNTEIHINGRDNFKTYHHRMAQVHILGTRSWKSIKSCPYLDYTLTFPTYLNGALHWFCLLGKKLIHMVSFDCEKECFLPFSSPPLSDDKRANVGMGVLGGCLCICESSNPSLTCVWVMKNYGVENSWTKVFEIDMSCSDRLLLGVCQPIKYMDNGALLMFNYPSSVLIYYDPRKPGLKLFEFQESKYEIVAHTPSFISLKDVLSRNNVEVLNVYSRCAGLKIKGETRAISLHGKTIHKGLSDSDSHLNLDLDPDYEYFLTNCSYYEWEQYWWGKYQYCFSIF